MNWLFRNRRTGAITIVQPPNAILWIFFGASALRSLLDPDGIPYTALEVVASVALLLWAGDELVRGVNPWRRMLGTTVLIWQMSRIVT